MLQLSTGKEASLGESALQYARHRPERTLLYQLIDEYYPVFEAQWASEGRALPDYVRQEFEEYLKCGRLEHGFLRVRCGTCHAEHLVAFSCKRRGFCPSCGARRMAESAATHVIFEPVDFIAKLAALVPKPRVNLTRFYGVFAPNSKHRALATPAKRGKGNKPKAADGQDEQTPVQRHVAMTWAQRLKRVFNIDVERCRICGGSAKDIACIEDPVVIKKILIHLEEKAPTRAALLLPDSRAPP